jgi:hypothetical protein
MLPRSVQAAKLLEGAAADLLSADLPDFGDGEDSGDAEA